MWCRWFGLWAWEIGRCCEDVSVDAFCDLCLMDVRLTLLGLEVDLVQSRRRWCAGPVDEVGLGIVGWSRRGELQLMEEC